MLPISFAESLQTQELPGYKYVNPMRHGQFSLKYGLAVAPEATITQDELLGARFESPDRSKIILLRRNGITCSIVQGYSTWSDLKRTAQEIWPLFRGWAGRTQVSRLALRYINVIEIPLASDFDDYLASAPRVPSELPQLIASFFERVIIPFTEADAHAIVIQATEPKPGPSVSVVLDIDVQCNRTLDASDVRIWETLDKIREIKNLIFFSHMTEKGLEAYR